MAMLYTLTRDDAALSKLSRDEIAEMVMSGNMKGEIGFWQQQPSTFY